TFKQGAGANASISTGLSTKIQYCSDTGLSSQVCFDGVTAKAGVNASIGGFSVSHEIKKTLVDKACTGADYAFDLPTPAMPTANDQLAHLAGFSSAQAALPAAQAGAAANPPEGGPNPNGQVIDAAGGDGVCAQVKLRLEQEAVMTRTAFDATLEINNGDTSK